MASMTFPNFPKREETGAPDIPELPAPPIRGREERESKTGTGFEFLGEMRELHHPALEITA